MAGKAKTAFGGMTIAEARQILHVRDNATPADLEKVLWEFLVRLYWHLHVAPCKTLRLVLYVFTRDIYTNNSYTATDGTAEL